MVCIAFALKSLFLTQNSVLPTSTKVSQKRHGRWCENIVSCVRSQLAASEVAPVFSDWCVSAIAAHAGQSAPNAHSHYMSRHPKSPYFEGWYLRLTLPESNTSYSFIFAVEAPSVGTVQVFDAQDTLYVHQLPRDTRLTLSTSSWTLSQWGYAFPTSLIKRCNGVRIDSPLSYSCRHVLQGWHLDAYGTQGTFVSNDVPVQWAFNYQPTLSWGPRGSGKHTGTWLANYPIFEPGYQVLMAHGCVSSGYIKIGDDFIDTKGSIVYAEKNWGRSFPSRWFWMQCNTFWTEPDLCVVALGAIRKVLSFEETVGMIAIHYKGRFYEFANWTCTSLQWAVRWGCWSVASVSRDGFRAQLTGTTSENGVQILGPTDHGMRFTMRDTMHGHLRVSLIDPSGNTVVETNSTNAQLEIGGEPWGKEWMASVPGLKQPLRDAIYECNIIREKIHHNKTMVPDSICGTTSWEICRMALISWMADECEAQYLQMSTLFLAVTYLDSLFIQEKCTFSIAKHLSAVCILLAAKMNEADGDAMKLPSFEGAPINVDDELDVLEALEWQIKVPTAYTFLCFYAHRFWVPAKAAEAATLYLKRIVSYIDSQSFYPSTLALVAITLVYEQNQLPAACWPLLRKLVDEEDERRDQFMMAVSTFKSRCPLALNQSIDPRPVICNGSNERASSTNGSSTTAYASSGLTTVSSDDPDSDASSR